MSASALLCYYCNIILKELCPSYNDSALIHAMQDYLDAKHPTLYGDSYDENSNDSGSNDGYHVEKTNSNYNRAEEEFNTFESFKRNKYRPKWARVNSEILSGIGHNGNMQEIIVGPGRRTEKTFHQAKIWETTSMRKVEWMCLNFLTTTRSASL